MAVRSIHYVQLAVPAGGEAEARSFYGDALGIPEVPKPPHPASRGGCRFEPETVRIHLGVEKEFRPAKKAHPALLVTNLAELAAQMRARGHVVVDDEPLQGYRRVYVSDPFGIRVELRSKPPASAA